jgi:hypothetical protein
MSSELSPTTSTEGYYIQINQRGRKMSDESEKRLYGLSKKELRSIRRKQKDQEIMQALEGSQDSHQ